jgi:tRNA A-37 threonylcarbamoyl transferase component Bud32
MNGASSDPSSGGGYYHPGLPAQGGKGGFTSLLKMLGGEESVGLEEGSASAMAAATVETPGGGAGGDRGPAPETIGRFQVLGEIGRGGIGVVYRVHDPDLGRVVALKVLHAPLRRQIEACQRFIEESQIGGQLQHPGIVPIHEMGVLPGPLPYFTMKLVKGKTLAAILSGRLSVEEDRQGLLSIIEQVAQTLAYAHSRGVIHRDLKPSNVMVGAFGEVQVMDWGLAKVLAEGGLHDERKARKTHFEKKSVSMIRTSRSSGSGAHSVMGSVMGTPLYMPPEQARGEVEDLDERSDVFGLGAILCEVLTGKPPYEGGTWEELQGQAESGDLSKAEKRLGECGVEGELIALAKECLAADPRHRPRDAGQVAKVLREYFNGMDRRARAAAEDAAAARVGARGARRARRLTVGIGLAAVLAVAAGVGGYLHLERSRREQSALEAAAVERLLGEARTVGAEAKGAGPRDLSKWPAALDAAGRA